MRNAIRMFHVMLLAGLLAACGGDDPVGSSGAGSSGSIEAGPLGAVEVGKGEGMHIRSLLAHTGAPSTASWLRHSIELASRDGSANHTTPASYS